MADNISTQSVLGIELNPKLVGALFTDRADDRVRLFCYYTTGETFQFEVPGLENQESLGALYAALKIDETCTCLIVEDVVMGRLYARHNECHFLYTLLKTPGNAPGTRGTDITSKDWEVIWQMPGIEILQTSQPGEGGSSISIRTQIGESDAVRMMKESRVFTQPVSKARAVRRSGFHLYLGIVLLAAALLAGGAVYYNLNLAKAEPTPPIAPAAPDASPAPAPIPKEGNLYLLFNHQISGPFPGKMVQVMASAGLLYPETLWRMEGSNEWTKLKALPPVKSSP